MTIVLQVKSSFFFNKLCFEFSLLHCYIVKLFDYNNGTMKQYSNYFIHNSALRLRRAKYYVAYSIIVDFQTEA